jgi:hypothetical protein
VISTGADRALHFRTDSQYGDPLLWSDATPAPTLTNRVPAIRLTPYRPPVPLQPAASGYFVDGVWRGYVSFASTATNVSVGCTLDASLDAHSNPFTVSADEDNDGMPDDWETQNRLDPTSSGDAAMEPDQDGVDNLSEFLANTDPHDATSQLRIVAIERNSPSIRIQVSTVLDRTYRLQRATRLAAPAVWTDLAEPLAGTGDVIEFIDSQALPGASFFYRVEVFR